LTLFFSEETASMIRFHKFGPLVALLLGAAFLGLPPPAHAAITLTIAEAGFQPVVVAYADNGNGVISYAGSVGDFNIQWTFGYSNAPGTGNLAELAINNSSVSTQGFTGDRTLTITLKDDSFYAPANTPGLSLVSQLATTQLPGNSNVTFQSFLDNNPGYLLTLDTIGGVTTSNSVSVTNTPYTLANVTTYTVHGQGTGNQLLVQSTGLTAVTTPAPPGVVLTLAGIPFVGFGCWLRRRQRA
jgi:hypothetical protein